MTAAPDARPRILHLITDLDTGGAERMLCRLVSGADRAGFHHIVVSMMDDGRFGGLLRQAGLPVYTLGMRRGVPSPAGLVRLLALLRRERPRLMQTWLYHADLLGLIAAKLAGVPRLVWNLRCSDMELGHYSPVTAGARRLLARLSGVPDAVIVNSGKGRTFHEGIGYRPRLWRMIPNGVDVNEYRPDEPARQAVRRTLGIGESERVIGLVARYDPMKDHATFFAAAARLAAADPGLRFVLIGRGLEAGRPELTAELERHGLADKILLLGERSDIADLTRGFDIAVSSSAFGEGFPNVIVEAMASAVPCVVTDVGDSAVIVGDTGLIVPPREPAALAGALGAVLALSPRELKAMGRAARDRVERDYALPVVIRHYEELYRNLLRGGDGFAAGAKSAKAC